MIKGIGARLQARREELGITRLMLAGRLGLEYEDFVRLEDGEAEIDLETLVLLCRFLSTTPDSLLGWNEQ